ncbi:MAG: DUF2269 family protein [Gaiellaceae bacterium]
MSKSDWLLMFHVTAAFLLVGGSVAAAILNALAIRSDRPSEAAFLLRLIQRALPFIFAGVIGTLVFGIWLWHDKGYPISSGWIWGALALWVAASALGGAGGRHQERSRELAEKLAAAGDTTTDELRALLRDPKGNALSWLAGIATLGVLVLMIWKPGA